MKGWRYWPFKFFATMLIGWVVLTAVGMMCGLAWYAISGDDFWRLSPPMGSWEGRYMAVAGIAAMGTVASLLLFPGMDD